MKSLNVYQWEDYKQESTFFTIRHKYLIVNVQRCFSSFNILSTVTQSSGEGETVFYGSMTSYNGDTIPAAFSLQLHMTPDDEKVIVSTVQVLR